MSARGRRGCRSRALIDGGRDRTGYDRVVLAMPAGERRLANVRKLMRLARRFEADQGRDVRRFVSLVDELAAERFGGPVQGEAPVESDSDGPVDAAALNAVRIMTIHRAKGLEFPVVCVADLGRRPPAGRDIVALGEVASRGDGEVANEPGAG